MRMRNFGSTFAVGLAVFATSVLSCSSAEDVQVPAPTEPSDSNAGAADTESGADETPLENEPEASGSATESTESSETESTPEPAPPPPPETSNPAETPPPESNAGSVEGAGSESAVALEGDAILTSQWLDISQECMGPGRVYGTDDPNPKKDEVCVETCNVPCGFEDPSRVAVGTAGFQQIGNKVCACAAGVFGSPCGCQPLPSIGPLLPVSARSCENEFGAPLPGTWDQTPDNLFVDHMDGLPCTTQFAGCMSPDLPVIEDGSCEATTPKGCLCLGGEWDCRSTNDWFSCIGEDCPQAFIDAGIANGNLKGDYCGE